MNVNDMVEPGGIFAPFSGFLHLSFCLYLFYLFLFAFVESSRRRKKKKKKEEMGDG